MNGIDINIDNGLNLDMLPDQEPVQSTLPPQQEKFKFESRKVTATAIDIDSLKRNMGYFAVLGYEDLLEEDIPKIEDLALKLARKRYFLRCMNDNRNTLELSFSEYPYKDIYLAFKGMGKGIEALLDKPKDSAYSYASWILKNTRKNIDSEYFNNLSSLAQAFRARDVHIMLGKDFDTLPDFLIIYTKNGVTGFSKDFDFKSTPQQIIDYIYLCRLFGVKIFNINNEESYKELMTILED